MDSKIISDEVLTSEERDEFEDKFCRGNLKAEVLNSEEVEILRKKGRI